MQMSGLKYIFLIKTILKNTKLIFAQNLRTIPTSKVQIVKFSISEQIFAVNIGYKI